MRESFEIRKEYLPELWLRYSAQRLLRAALLGQGELDEAETLLLSAYRAMKERELSMPSAMTHLISDSAQ